MEWKPIETAPKDREVTLRAADGRRIKAMWYFGDWGTTEPILGDRLDYDFVPIEWSHFLGDRTASTKTEADA